MAQVLSPRKLPVRKCTGCAEHFPKMQLIRVLRTPEGEILLDATGKKSGREAVKDGRKRKYRIIPERGDHTAYKIGGKADKRARDRPEQKS